MLMITATGYSIERPAYTVLKTDGDMQIRQYEEYFVAETTYDGSTGSGFRKLFKYISGNNQANQQIEMTSPVTRHESIKIEMTSPVTIQEGSEKTTMAFMIPSRFKENDIPVPLDPSVIIKKIPARIVAAHTYSWFATDSRNAKKAAELKKWVESLALYTITSKAIYAGYDSPYTMPQNKTHEMMFILEE